MDPRDLGSEIGAADEFGVVQFLNIHSSASGDTLFVQASADPQETWPGGIFHNSRYAVWRYDGTLRLLSSGLGMPRFRTRKASLERAAELIADYMSGML